MDQMHAGLLLLLLCSAYSYQFRGRAGYGSFVQDPEREWERMETVIGEEMAEARAHKNKFLRSPSSSGSETPTAKEVPEYVVVSSSEDKKEVFKPEKGARPLPDEAKEILTPTTTASTRANPRQKMVEMLCHVDRVYVRIRREIFMYKDSYKYLKLGTCPVNQGTKLHYYLLYLLKTDCGFKKEYNKDFRSVGNGLTFKRPGEVIREMPFFISLECKYPRFFHSYKVGFYPVIRGGTALINLTPKSTFTLSPQDASGNVITGAKTYILGQPMYFEAKHPDSSSSPAGKRLYINKCYMTPSQNPNSTPKYTFINNHGCMIDGMMTDQSKFIAGSSKMSQRFSVTAVIFKDSASSSSSSSSSKQTYMHCDISMGGLTPTSTAKACNYNSAAKKWKALFGDDSVCTCCSSTCSSARASSGNVVSSRSWKVDLGSMDRLDKVGPRMKFSDADTFSLDDPDMEEHKDFLKYWDDY